MNYGQIKAAVINYTNRSDFDASDYMDMVNQRLYFGEVTVPSLRISAMLKTATTFTLPTDWLETTRLMSGANDLTYYSPRELQLYTTSGGPPIGYTIENRTVTIGPTNGTDPLAYTYYGKFDDLVDDADENWLSINAPNVYISSFLVEWARKSRDDALLARESQGYASAVSALNSSDKAAQISGATLRRMPGSVPYR